MALIIAVLALTVGSQTSPAFHHPPDSPISIRLVHERLATQAVSSHVTAPDAKKNEAAVRRVTGRVIRVIDGDTFELRAGNATNHRVRVAGIDAPERNQPFYRASREALADLIAGRTVRVDGYKTDRWGRLIGNVFVADEDAGLALVQRGLAWHFKRFAGEQTSATRRAYEHAQAQARASQRGLWSLPQPVAPWDFRRRH